MAVESERIGPSLRTSFIVLGAGIAVAITGGVGTGVVFARSVLGSAAVSLPADLHRHLGVGAYEIYQRTGTRRGGNGFTFSNNGPASISPADVTVTGPTGERLPTEPASNVTETITRGSAIYTGAVKFDVPSSGDYDIRIGTSGGGLPEVIVTRTLGGAVRAAVGWLLLLAVGVLAATVGVVLLIVGIVRRNRSSQTPTGYVPAYIPMPAPAHAPAYAATPPPGWFPDPGGSGRQRWWDGARWTDYLS